ncbi:MAG TPA: hypothetical protein VMB80_04760 [Candidatus Acidoferrum sp.]|nr:hypothetical protein [Candidatus Acidoferrum sp.]
MKRSKRIRLILLGGLSAGALTGCEQKPAISTENVYTNNFFIPGAGYYHAPFRGWYALPYNHFDTQKNLYFYGGQWGAAPFESITNLSSPTTEAAQAAQNARTDIARGGFGGFGGTHYSGGGWGYYS